jgi:hypothetical protein
VGKAVLIAVLLAGCASTRSEARRYWVTSGVVWAQLDEDVSFADRVGAPITAHVANSVVSQAGKVVIPRGAVLAGEITELTMAKRGEPALARLAFTEMRYGGARHQIHAEAEIVETDVAPVPTPYRVRGQDLAVAGDEPIGGVLGGGEVPGTAVSLGCSERTFCALPAGTFVRVRIPLSRARITGP